jgi:hypothetical protein
MRRISESDMALSCKREMLDAISMRNIGRKGHG